MLIGFVGNSCAIEADEIKRKRSAERSANNLIPIISSFLFRAIILLPPSGF
jgi:hypothetical protein